MYYKEPGPTRNRHTLFEYTYLDDLIYHRYTQQGRRPLKWNTSNIAKMQPSRTWLLSGTSGKAGLCFKSCVEQGFLHGMAGVRVESRWR